MEQKVEQLLLRGLTTLLQYQDSFFKEWKEFLPAIKYQNESFSSQLEKIFQFINKQILSKQFPSVDSLILALLAEWQKRFSTKYDEYEAIFFVTSIENVFHKVIANNPEAIYLDHQSVQAFFLRILDQALLSQDYDKRTDKWAKIILATNVIPMEWIAVLKREAGDFQLDEIVCSNDIQIDDHLLEMCSSLKAHKIDHLAQAIERLLGTGERQILQIPCLNDTLLICLEDGDVPVSNHQIEFIREIYLRQLRLHHLESKLDWKNASLLFLQHLLRSRTADDALKAISQGLVDYMPFSRCALFLHNHFEDTGVGVSGYNVSAASIQQIKEEIFKLPLIKRYLASLMHSQPLYFANAAEILPEKYVREYKLTSIVVLPIYVPTENKLLGIALLDQGENSQFTVSMQTLTALIKFGHYAGELLFSIWDETLEQLGSMDGLLTQREKEVLKLIAEGASINEAAHELHLSSYTVRDYVSAIIQKLDAKNRTDAAVKAIRLKLLS